MDSAQVLDINDPNVEAFADFDPDETEFVYNTPAQYEEIFMKNNINHNEVSLFNIWQTIHKFFGNILHSPNIISIDRDIFSQNMKIYELLCDNLDLFASVKDSVYTTLQDITLKSMDCFDDFFFDKFLTEFEKHRTIFNKQVQIVNHYHRVSKHPPQVFTEEYPIFQKQKRIMAALMSFLKDEMLPRSCNRIIKKIQKLRELFILIIETSPTDADKLKEAGTNAFDNIITLVLDLKGMLLGRQLLNMSMQFIPPSKIEAQKRSFLSKDEILRQQIENEKTYKQMIESRGTERIAQQNSENLRDLTNLFNLILSLDSNSELIQNAIEMLKKGIENKDIIQDVSKRSFISSQENLRKFLRSISLVLPKVEFHDAKLNLGLISTTQSNDKYEIINKLIQSIDQLSGRIMKTSQISQVMINLRAIKDFEECKEIYEKFNNYFFPLYHIIEVIEQTNDALRSFLNHNDFSPLYLDFDNLIVDNIPQEFITKFNDCCEYLKHHSLDISLTDTFHFDNLIIPNIYPILKEISDAINKLPHNAEFAFAHKFNENIFEKSEKFQNFFQTELEMMKLLNTTSDYPCLNEILSKLALFRYLDKIFFMLDIIRKVPYEISVQNTYLRLNYIINDQCDHLKNSILIKPLNPKHLQEIFYKQGLLKLVFFMKMYWPNFLDHNIENSIKIFKMFIKALQDKQFDGLMPLFQYISSQNSVEIQPAEDILQLSFILLSICTSINFNNGVINSTFTNLSSHGFIEYFYNFNVQNYDSIFDPLNELIDSLNSPRLTHKLASLRYGSSSTQSLVELALYVISDPKLAVNLKEFKEKLLPVTSFILNIECIDFVANLVCSQLQTTLMKPYAVASFNVPRFSFMFADLILYLNTTGIIPTSESYKAIQYSLLLKNIHPPNFILGNDIKKMLQKIREASSFVSKYCNKSNPAIQTLFSRLKTTIQLTLKSSELPLAFLSTIHEKLFLGESVTEDSYILLSYFDENDPIYSNLKAFFDCIRAIQSVIIIIDKVDSFDINLGYWRFELFNIPFPVSQKRYNPKVELQYAVRPRYSPPTTLLSTDQQKYLIKTFENLQEERIKLDEKIKEYNDLAKQKEKIENDIIDTQIDNVMLIEDMKETEELSMKLNNTEDNQVNYYSKEYHDKSKELYEKHIKLTKFAGDIVVYKTKYDIELIKEVPAQLLSSKDQFISDIHSEPEIKVDEKHNHVELNEELLSLLNKLSLI